MSPIHKPNKFKFQKKNSNSFPANCIIFGLKAPTSSGSYNFRRYVQSVMQNLIHKSHNVHISVIPEFSTKQCVYSCSTHGVFKPWISSPL